MDWDDIRIFLAVAREGSIARAATELDVSYTTVARRLESFEDRLGTRLFDRSRGGCAPTSAAEEVLREALSMEEHAIAFDRRLFGHDRKLSGCLRVTSSDAVATGLVLPLLHRFREEHPAIHIELSTSDALARLDLREADVAVRMSAAPPEHLIGREICEVGYSVFASPDFRKAHRRLNTPKVCALCWIDDSAPWREREFAKTARGLSFDSPLALRSAIQAGLGIGMLPSFLGDEAGLVRVNRRPVPSGWSLWVLSHPDTRTTARVRVFRAFLVEALTEQRARIE